MKNRDFIIALGMLLVLGVAVSWSNRLHAPDLFAAPPLSLEGLLGEDEELSDRPPQDQDLKADNFMCLVCHGNFEKEGLVVSHAKRGVSCVDCHGPSVAHADDEDHVIPPDRMYDHSDVDQMCGRCHEMHDVPAREVIARWQERNHSTGPTDQVACTNCHYQHFLTRRTVRWNRKTRELIIREIGGTSSRDENLVGETPPPK